MESNKAVYIGTSGWHYAHWKGPFYPQDLRDEDMLGYYAAHFRTAEINNTFYRLPEKNTLARWRQTAPDGFIFAVKASRYITHMKKLKDAPDTLPKFFDRIKVLEDRLGPVLFQLPPKWGVNIERLEQFLKTLPGDFRYAFEFRDPSWFREDVSGALAGKGAAFCIYDFEGRQSPLTVTGNLVYVRLHGPDGAYRGQYGAETLELWAQLLRGWSEQGREVYCYFDNDEAGYAAQDALRLKSLVER